MRAWAWLVAAAVLLTAWPAAAGWRQAALDLAADGALLVEDAHGAVLLETGGAREFIPASTLKLATAYAALETLGPGYRFATILGLTQAGGLVARGLGDPFLVSEELALIAAELKERGVARVGRLWLDDSFFALEKPLDGNAGSPNPYDAGNGALAVNFNTIHVLIGPEGEVETAEDQTPLTPVARALALSSALVGTHRLSLGGGPGDGLIHAGQLLAAFLEEAGIPVEGPIARAAEGLPAWREVLCHRSSRTLAQVVATLMEYSNNFMANQLFLVLGAQEFGPPATGEKARLALKSFLAGRGLSPSRLEEGSGLSRLNRATAPQLMRLVRAFEPYHGLLPGQGRLAYKTGTLEDVKNAVGYVLTEPGGQVAARFVLLLDGEGATFEKRDNLLRLLEENIK